MKKIVIYFLLTLCHTVFSHGQSKDSMANFRFMEGIWKGNGWIIEGNTKLFFKETETVKSKVNNTAIQIEAFGLEVNDSTKVVNNALGILFQEKNTFKLHFYQADGSFLMAEAKLNAVNEMEWGLTISSALKIRYIIKVDGNKWLETGFKSIDHGLSWNQTFEMILLKSE